MWTNDRLYSPIFFFCLISLFVFVCHCIVIVSLHREQINLFMRYAHTDEISIFLQCTDTHMVWYRIQPAHAYWYSITADRKREPLFVVILDAFIALASSLLDAHAEAQTKRPRHKELSIACYSFWVIFPMIARHTNTMPNMHIKPRSRTFKTRKFCLRWLVLQVAIKVQHPFDNFIFYYARVEVYNN